MSDMSSMNRESKKRQLRRQMITPGHPGPYSSNRVSEEELQEAHQRSRRRKLWLAIGIVAVILACAGGFFYYQQRYQYTTFETAWEVTMSEGSLVGYEPFGTNVLRYTKDGASYIDNRGRTVWTESYEMANPTVSVNGDFAAIADKQGNTIYICSVDGKAGQATTVLPISKVAVSGIGMAAAVLEDSTSSYIYFYRRDGSVLDIQIKSNMAGNGYPLDISLSRDGTQMISSYVHVDDGEVRNRVVFYNFSEIGQNVPTRIVGGFDDDVFQDTMVPRVTYLQEPYSCAFGGNGPVFFSTRNLAGPEVVGQPEMTEDTIESVFYSQEYVAVVVRNTAGEYESRLEVFQADGSPVLTKEFTYDYTEADIDGELIILYNENSCRIFNMAGVEKLYAAFDFPVSRIRKGRFPNTLVVTGPQQMREIKLQ